MKRIAQIGIGTAALRPARTKLAEHEGSEERHDPARGPHAENCSRCVDALRHYRRSAKDARADDAAHHDEQHVVDAETPR